MTRLPVGRELDEKVALAIGAACQPDIDFWRESYEAAKTGTSWHLRFDELPKYSSLFESAWAALGAMSGCIDSISLNYNKNTITIFANGKHTTVRGDKSLAHAICLAILDIWGDE